jgi:hypothetical protein
MEKLDICAMKVIFEIIAFYEPFFLTAKLEKND